MSKRGLILHRNVSISFPKDLLNIVDEIARKTGKTRSKIIQEALIFYLKNRMFEQEPQEVKKDFMYDPPSPPQQPLQRQVKAPISDKKVNSKIIKSPDSFWE